MSIKFYIPQWTVNNEINKQHGDNVPEKARGMFLCYQQINIKNRARCGSVLQVTCVLIKLEIFSTQM